MLEPYVLGMMHPAGSGWLAWVGGSGMGFDEALRGALALDIETFRQVRDFAPNYRLGLWVALGAGLSRSLAQAFILFINQVPRRRFALSLLLEAFLFLLSFLVWAGSTWLMVWLVGGQRVPLPLITRALGLAYAPQLFSFLGALPYLGVPWLTLLSGWTVLAFVTGLKAVTGLAIWEAFGCLVGGWLLAWLLQRTAGQPVVNATQWLRNRTAGVALVSDRERLRALVQAGRDERL